ncbi:MAG: winged helix-turn-helix domain-containing protein, partial [Gammaproteobacteria bacterium]|nr:winged helix-turn-helix domain-containing protein [Gammaproteobacteria bacterium]
MRRVEPKVMDVLVALAENAGEVVSRDALIDEVWHTTFVSDEVLSRCISLLRRALKDDPRAPRFIETIPRRGYRLIPPVVELAQAQGGNRLDADQHGDKSREEGFSYRLATVLYIDAVHHDGLSGQHEESTRRQLAVCLDCATDVVHEHNGTVCRFAGDALLAEFQTASDALHCAFAMQREIGAAVDPYPLAQRLHFRIGINLGEVIADRDEVYGEGVNIAARLQELAVPGGIVISAAVRSAVGNRLPLRYELIGVRTLKNIAMPVRAYRVFAGGRHPLAYLIKRRAPKLYVPAIVAVLCIAGLYAWQWYSSAGRTYDSIAVMKFGNDSDDESLAYLSNGVAEEILNLLAKVPGLKVVGKVSAFSFADDDTDIPSIAAALDVDTVLQGRISKSGDVIRVWVQLSDRENVQLWSESYHQQLQDIFAVQDQIARSVSSALDLSRVFGENVGQALDRTRPTSDSAAYLLYLQGIEQWNRRGEQSIRKAIQLFGQASVLDPSYPQPQLGIARAYAVLPFYSNEPRERAFTRAETAARRALELDPGLGSAHTTLAFVNMHRWNWEVAAREYGRALELQPNDATTHQWYSQFLANLGFFDKSFEQARVAVDLEPKSPAVRERLGATYLWLRNNESAEREFLNANKFGYAGNAIQEPYILLLWR